MSDLSIEPVTPQNFREYLGLLEKLAEYEHLTPPDIEAQERLKRDALTRPPKFEAYLGCIGGNTVSYITLYFTYSTFLARPTLYLEDIFVLEPYRKMGIGRSLLQFCRSLAAERGCGRMEWTVLTWNDPAIRFYERCGGKRLDWYLYRLNADDF